MANSRAFQNGRADTLHGIKTFPANGTDKCPNVRVWASVMRTAAKACKDKEYAKGVRAALKEKGL